MKNEFLFQALFYPEVEKQIFVFLKKILSKTFKLSKVKFENLEITGSLDDPFYDAVVMSVSGEVYKPDWENTGSFGAKGTVVLQFNIFKLLFFLFYLLIISLKLAFVFWRGYRFAKKNPNGENMDNIRKWIFLKSREAVRNAD